MVKKIFITCFALLSAWVASEAAPASANIPSAGKERGVKISHEQQTMIEAVQGKGKKNNRIRESRLIPLEMMNGYEKSGRFKINQSGSTVQGYMKSSWDDEDNGWYELLADGAQKLKWKYEPEDWDPDYGAAPFPFNCGFLKNGNVYGFESESFFGYAFIGHGIFTLDGEFLEFEEDFYEDLSQYTFSCAYDATENVVYAYTLNSDATGYMFQKVNPETWQFTIIDDDIEFEDICVAFTWCLEDSKLYGVTTEGKFVNVAKDGSLTLIEDLDLGYTNATCGFTYSPIDNAFFLVYSADYESKLYIIDYNTLTTDFVDYLWDVLQYTILICDDKKLSPETPKTPEINYLIFENGSQNGSVSITLPTETYANQPLAGDLTLLCKIDHNIVKTFLGQPGQTIVFDLEEVPEGKRVFTFQCNDGDTEGIPTQKEFYVGYDTPYAPESVYIESDMISWEPYMEGDEGINGGYVDVENLTYNVYLNNEKLNQEPIRGTSFLYEIPDVDYSKFIAGVETINHGHISDRRNSDNSILAGKGLELPLFLKPDYSEASLFDTYPMYSWFYYSLEDGFATDTYSWEEVDNWLILPKIHIPKGDKLIEFSFEGHVDWDAQNVELCIMSSLDVETARTIKTFQLTNLEDYDKYSARFAAEENTDIFIAIKAKTHEDGSLMKVRNFSVNMTDSPTTVPNECFAISVIPAEKGELKAKVNFTLPLTDAANNNLSNSTQLKATVVSPAATITAIGVPGETLSLDIATVQGFNIFEIYAVSEEGEGLTSNVKTFTGIDIPEPLSVLDYIANENNTGVTLTWEPPTKGVNNGYISPELLTYALCMINEDGYAYIVEELGNVTSYTYTDPANESMHLAELGILTQSVEGTTGTVRFVNIGLGTPYTLPMDETFNGEHSITTYNPILIRMPEGYGDFLGINYLGWLPDPLEAYGIMGYSYEAGDRARIEIPKFSTEDIDEAAVEVTAFCGDGVGKIQILGKTYGTDYSVIGEIKDNVNSGWKTFRFMLPQSMTEQTWVQIAFDAIYDAPDEVIAISRYKVTAIREKDLSLTSILSNKYGVAGEDMILQVTVSNEGLEILPCSSVKVDMVKGDNIIRSLILDESEKTMLQPMEETIVYGKWNPSAEEIGDINIVYSLVYPDDYDKNNIAEKPVSISKGNSPVIDDLAVVLNEEDNSVTLSWTVPVAENGFEGFENYNSFTVLDRYGSFVNFDGDNYNEKYFALFDLPEQWDPKAWQIIGTREVTEIMEEVGESNTYFQAASGDKFAASFTPYEPYSGTGVTAENWLISPELIPGSNFSLKLANLKGYSDDVTVRTSPNGENFTVLETISLNKGKWEEFSFTLPEGDLYFAIVANSDTDYGFVVLIDDINFEPVNKEGMIIAYDIYRNGILIEKEVTAAGHWVDNEPLKGKSNYYIVPIIKTNDTLKTGVQSNMVFIENGTSGVESFDSNIYVQAFRNNIVINNAKGLDCKIFDSTGIEFYSGIIESDSERISLEDGIYIVTVKDRYVKIHVK